MSKKDWKKVKEEFEERESMETEMSEESELAIDEETKFESESCDDEKAQHQLREAQQESQRNLEKAIRAVAEMENIRKRAERDVMQARLYGQEKLIQSLIPVLDSLEQALVNSDLGEHENLREGVELTLKLFLSVLEKHDVVQLSPEGQPFNPQEHEAMSTQVSDAVAPNTILMVFQKGYKLNDRIIRPARVIVAKAVS